MEDLGHLLGIAVLPQPPTRAELEAAAAADEAAAAAAAAAAGGSQGQAGSEEGPGSWLGSEDSVTSSSEGGQAGDDGDSASAREGGATSAGD